MAAPSEEFFVRFRYWLVKGGTITRMACGTMTRRNRSPSLRPSDCAASVCPLLTERIPARTVSAMKEAV
ncbi:hypothetical protein D3C87_1980430 [compost metagenome]